MKTETDIFDSCEEANDALGPCPNPKAESDGGHWWYINGEAEEQNDGDWIECICGTCPQRMRLSPDAEEYPL